ncbi:unnamed protein product, partial [Brassica oleracea var. botrytis]
MMEDHAFDTHRDLIRDFTGNLFIISTSRSKGIRCSLLGLLSLSSSSLPSLSLRSKQTLDSTLQRSFFWCDFKSSNLLQINRDRFYTSVAAERQVSSGPTVW